MPGDLFLKETPVIYSLNIPLHLGGRVPTVIKMDK